MSQSNAIERWVLDYEQSEPWKKPHNEVMQNYGIADQLRNEAVVGADLYERLRELRPRTFEESQMMYRYYVRWYEHSKRLENAIEESEQRGFVVEGIAGFRAAVCAVEAFIEIVRERITVLENFIAGRGIPAERFIEQL
jgi:hypothetical protein